MLSIWPKALVLCLVSVFSQKGSNCLSAFHCSLSGCLSKGMTQRNRKYFFLWTQRGIPNVTIIYLSRKYCFGMPHLENCVWFDYQISFSKRMVSKRILFHRNVLTESGNQPQYRRTEWDLSCGQKVLWLFHIQLWCKQHSIWSFRWWTNFLKYKTIEWCIIGFFDKIYFSIKYFLVDLEKLSIKHMIFWLIEIDSFVNFFPGLLHIGQTQ